jgi:hypothetical protein
LSGERLWIDSASSLPRALWLPTRLNWWIGAIFAVGAALFALGAVLSLAPELAARWSLQAEQINRVFFAGSIPFTTAAWLQLMQSANAGSFAAAEQEPAARFRFFGWYPADAGWLSCALQFAGTVLFNLNTYNALPSGLTWQQQDTAVWLPDLFGSMLFLASGYLAFIETCHRRWGWMPHLLSWRITFVNLLGCIAFMISALLAFVPAQGSNATLLALSLLFTLLGAIGFFVGAILMLPEADT